MFVDVIAYENNILKIESCIEVDKKLNNKLFGFFEKPTIVFIPCYLYDKLPSDNKKDIDNNSLDQDMSVDEILSKDIMFIKFDNDEHNNILLDLIRSYTKEPVDYLLISEY